MSSLTPCVNVWLAACLLVCTLPSIATAQPAAVQASPAKQRDLRDFDFMVEKITTNYAGYDTKTAGAKRAELAALTARLRARVGTGTLSTDELLAVLQEWIGFFHDRHTGVVLTAAAPGTAPSSPTAADVPRLDWTEAGVMQRLTALGRKRDPIEGIWTIGGDRYRLAVLRTGATPDAFSAVTLGSTMDGWSPGMVKATLTRTAADYDLQYFNGVFEIEPHRGHLVVGGAVLEIQDYGSWSREWPAVKDKERIARAYPPDEFFLRRLSPRTMWLRLPDFNNHNAVTVTKLLQDNAAALGATANLLIDARGNGGGSDFVYAPIIRYLYTRPIYEVGVELRATRDNIALRKAFADGLKGMPGTADALKEFNAQNELMAKHVGEYVQPSARPFGINKLDQVLPFPKRVVILIDQAASSGEQFLLAARQSRKVTLVGKRNSAGVLDFANVVNMPGPSGRYALHWATSRSLRLPDDPVDEGGIAPDIRIPEAEADPVTYAQRWLERQVD